MSRRTRIFLGILASYAAGIAFLLYRVVIDIDPRYRESAEESLVETSQLLASLVEQDVIAGAINPARLEPLFRSVYAREFSAQIYNLHKNRVELRVYVTDRTGRVLFDSTGRAAGTDYSQWNDVTRSLAGLYGARTSRDVEGDPLTSVMYVGAPVRWAGEIVGVVSAGKPCPLPTIEWAEAVLTENEAFAQCDQLRLTTPDDFMTRRGVFAAADIAAESSDQANGCTQSLGRGQSFFLA